MIIRRRLPETKEELFLKPKELLILFGILLPILILHTIIGAFQFLNADLILCREKHSGEVLYILSFMFASFMSIVLLSVLCYIVFPKLLMNHIKPKNLNSRDEENNEEFTEE